MLPAGNAPPGASEPASELLFQYLLQHLLIQTQIGHQFLQPLIFILQLPQTPQFRHAQTSKFLLPVVKCGLRNAHLSADFPDAGAGFGLFQRKRNLFFGITGLFHGNKPLCEQEERSETSVQTGTVFRGRSLGGTTE